MDNQHQFIDSDTEADILEAFEGPKGAARRAALSTIGIQPTPPGEDVEDESADLAMLDGNIPVEDAFGPLADQLAALFIDEVDPLTAEVTRRPVPQESDPQLADAETPETLIELPAHQVTEAPAILPPPDTLSEPETETAEFTSEPVSEERAMSTIVAYLLSPEETPLRRQTHEAAYNARKAAYEAAYREVQPQIKAIQASIHELEASFQEGLKSIPETRADLETQEAWQAAHREVELARRAYQTATDRLELAAGRADQAKLLAGQGKLPTLVSESLAANYKMAVQACEEARALYNEGEQKLEEAAQAREIAQAGRVELRQKLEEQTREEHGRLERELARLGKRLKERQEEIAGLSPEVILWKAVQAERRRREDEIAGKLIRELPAQGIKRTLQEAARLGVPQNMALLGAVAERQIRVDLLIEACRAQAERLAAYPEVLPESAYALLVRGDAIRVVDPGGRELAVHYAQGDGSEFHTVRSQNGRRWKLDPPRDLWLVKQ